MAELTSTMQVTNWRCGGTLSRAEPYQRPRRQTRDAARGQHRTGGGLAATLVGEGDRGHLERAEDATDRNIVRTRIWRPGAR